MRQLISALILSAALTAPALAASSVVKVNIETEDGSGHGSGVHIGGGKFLTAAHVAQEGAKLTVKTDDGKEAPATLVWRDGALDVAVIRAMPGDAKSSKLACAAPYIGQELHASGHPGPFEDITTYGRVAGKQLAMLPNWKVVVPVDITGGAGMSGGPLFNEKNQVSAIFVAGYQVPGSPVFRAFWFVVPASAFCPLVRDAA